MRHQKQNCAPHFAEIEVDFEPAAEGFVFQVARGLSVEFLSTEDVSHFVAAAALGIEEQLTSPENGQRVVIAARVVLRHVRAHESDSHELAFKIAGYLAARRALERAGSHPA
ncbi:hypothetical protein [Streptomyces sp. FZ201]|uniref:hypothetical protein n=1 Tax=Streptomyces sp. FZ201 TaxID=3057122 RepID=UPI0021BFD027|nr:hypothetical protein [Streptomyces sp. FZ201]